MLGKTNLLTSLFPRPGRLVLHKEKYVKTKTWSAFEDPRAKDFADAGLVL